MSEQIRKTKLSRMNDSSVIEQARHIVSQFPGAVNQLSKLLRKRSTIEDYELHFATFVELGCCEFRLFSEEEVNYCLHEVSQYCQTSKRDWASAIFAAVDLLMEHAPLQYSIPHTKEVLTNGNYWHAKEAIASRVVYWLDPDEVKAFASLKNAIENCRERSQGSRCQLFDRALQRLQGEELVDLN